MLRFALTTLVTAVSLIIVDSIIPGVGIATFPVALGAALSLGLVNGAIKPIVQLLSLPVTLLTLGGFSLFVNGFCFWLASLVVPGFTIHGLLGFTVGPIALSFISNFLMNYIIRNELDKKLIRFGRKLDLVSAEETSYQPASEQVILVEATEVL